MYRVVAFSDDTVATVPSVWWRGGDDGDGTCYWPPKGSNAPALVKRRMEPDSSWTPHEAKTIFTTDDMLQAKRMEKRAEETSDMDGAVSMPQTRRRKKNPRYISSEDSDAEEEANGPAAAPPQQRPRNNIALISPPPPPEGLGIRGGSQQRPTVDGAGTSRPTLGQRAEAEASPARNEPDGGLRESRILMALARIHKQLLSLDAQVKANGAAIRAIQTGVRASPSLPKIPLETTEDFRRFNRDLTSPQVFEGMVERLVLWCSGDRVDLDVRSILRALISNALAEQLSLRGRNGKDAVVDTPAFDIICASVRRAGGHPSKQEIGVSVGKWLSGSRDRNGKRLARMKKNRMQERGAGDQGEGAGVAAPDMVERELQFDEL